MNKSEMVALLKQQSAEYYSDADSLLNGFDKQAAFWLGKAEAFETAAMWLERHLQEV